MEIILDTNFIVYCAKEKLDYVEEIEKLFNENYEIVVPKQVIEELEKIKEKKKERIPLFKRTSRYRKTTGRDKRAADLGLQILEKSRIKKINIKGESVDDAIVNLGKKGNNIVATLDKEMRGRLDRVILLNKNKKLILSN